MHDGVEIGGQLRRMVERVVGRDDEPVGLAGGSVKIRQQDFQRGAGVRQIVHGRAAINDELVDVLAPVIEHGGRVADIGQDLGDGAAVLVVKHRFQPIGDDEQPGQKLGRVIENLAAATRDATRSSDTAVRRPR